MIYHKILRKYTKKEELVEQCFRILEINNVTELPELSIGKRAQIFTSNELDITLHSTGKRQGYFICYKKVGECLASFVSALFEY